MTERELFNKWLKAQPDYKEISGYERIVMWKAWQASASRDGYKLVPVEPTEEMIDAGVDESDVDWKRLKFAYQAMIGAIE